MLVHTAVLGVLGLPQEQVSQRAPNVLLAADREIVIIFVAVVGVALMP